MQIGLSVSFSSWNKPLSSKSCQEFFSSSSSFFLVLKVAQLDANACAY